MAYDCTVESLHAESDHGNESSSSSSDLDNNPDFINKLKAEGCAFEAKKFRHWSQAMLRSLTDHIYLTGALAKKHESNVSVRRDSINMYDGQTLGGLLTTVLHHNERNYFERYFMGGHRDKNMHLLYGTLQSSSR